MLRNEIVASKEDNNLLLVFFLSMVFVATSILEVMAEELWVVSCNFKQMFHVEDEMIYLYYILLMFMQIKLDSYKKPSKIAVFVEKPKCCSFTALQWGWSKVLIARMKIFYRPLCYPFVYHNHPFTMRS